jgi:hypothetical protein
MARTKGQLSTGARLADFLTVGFLAMRCPVEAVKQVLKKNGAQSQRRRGLPREVLVYFVMMMVLYATVAYEDEPPRVSRRPVGLSQTGAA